MNTYGPPSGVTILTRAPGTVALQRARRAIAAAKNSAGWVRKSYLQSAIEHLSDVEQKILDQARSPARSYLTGAVVPVAPQLVEGLIKTTLEFYAVASEDELESAVAQVIRSYGLELDVSQAL
jgi:hypothetical protein